jgi:hypothetical protein
VSTHGNARTSESGAWAVRPAPRDYPQPHGSPVEPCGYVTSALRSLRGVSTPTCGKPVRPRLSRERTEFPPRTARADPLPKTAFTARAVPQSTQRIESWPEASQSSAGTAAPSFSPSIPAPGVSRFVRVGLPWSSRSGTRRMNASSRSTPSVPSTAPSVGQTSASSTESLAPTLPSPSSSRSSRANPRERPLDAGGMPASSAWGGDVLVVQFARDCGDGESGLVEFSDPLDDFGAARSS